MTAFLIAGWLTAGLALGLLAVAVGAYSDLAAELRQTRADVARARAQRDAVVAGIAAAVAAEVLPDPAMARDLARIRGLREVGE